jgi:hypothetical protein
MMMGRVSWIIAALLCTAAAEHGASKISHKSAALDFTYQWPAEAAAISKLDRKFRMEAAAAYRRGLALGRLDQKLYTQQGRGSVADFYSKQWTTAGETPRLLSLQYHHSAYTGGAHPNTDYGSLLWERKRARPIAVSSLFLRSAAFETLTRADYCIALDAERRKRRGKEWKPGLPEFNACPKFAELAIAPVDKTRKGRFDSIDFVASPYTAGPYVEGAYDILLPVTAQLIAAMRPEYRNSFELQRQ